MKQDDLGDAYVPTSGDVLADEIERGVNWWYERPVDCSKGRLCAHPVHPNWVLDVLERVEPLGEEMA